MISIATGKTRALTLMGDEELFNAANAALKKNNFLKGEDPDLFRTFDFALIDVEVLQQGLILTNRFPATRLILVAWAEDARAGEWKAEHEFTDCIHIPVSHRHRAAEIISNWLERPENLHLFDVEQDAGSRFWDWFSRQVKGKRRKKEPLASAATR